MSSYGTTNYGSTDLTATVKSTVVQLISATTRKPKLMSWMISFEGITNSHEPILVTLERQTTDGSLPTIGDEVPLDPDSPTSSITAFNTHTTQPTSGDILEMYLIHPQAGFFKREYAISREVVLDDATSSRIAITATAPNAITAAGWIQWEE